MDKNKIGTNLFRLALVAGFIYLHKIKMVGVG